MYKKIESLDSGDYFSSPQLYVLIIASLAFSFMHGLMLKSRWGNVTAYVTMFVLPFIYIPFGVSMFQIMKYTEKNDLSHIYITFPEENTPNIFTFMTEQAWIFFMGSMVALSLFFLLTGVIKDDIAALATGIPIFFMIMYISVMGRSFSRITAYLSAPMLFLTAILPMVSYDLSHPKGCES